MRLHPTELLEDYALGLLPTEAEDRLIEHLSECQQCQQALGALEETLSLVAYTAPVTAPPLEAEDRLFARIAELRQNERREIATAPATAEATSVRPSRTLPVPRAADRRAQPVQRARAAEVVPFARSLPRRLAASRTLLAVAALAALLLLTVGVLGTQLQQAQAREATLAAQVREQEHALAIVSAPDAVTRSLTPTTAALGGASGTMVMDPAHGQGVLVLAHLPPAPAGKTYEFWLVQGAGGTETTIPTGTFAARADGSARLIFGASQPLSELRDAGISLEPAGGVAHPDSPMLMLLSA